MMKLMSGGSDALHEAELMVSEKVDAAFEAAASLVGGASVDEIVHRYRHLVAVNAKRLLQSFVLRRFSTVLKTDGRVQ
jgi:hypothetical protein